MDIEDAIAKLAEELDEWFEEGRSILFVPDRFAQGRAIERGVRIVQQLHRLKAEGGASRLTPWCAPHAACVRA